MTLSFAGAESVAAAEKTHHPDMAARMRSVLAKRLAIIDLQDICAFRKFDDFWNVSESESGNGVCASAFERNYGRVENTVGIRQQVSRNDRVCRVAPKRVVTSCRAILPRHIWESISLNLYRTHK